MVSNLTGVKTVPRSPAKMLPHSPVKTQIKPTWEKAKFSTVSEAKYCRLYSRERARACSRTGKAMVWHEDLQ